MYKKRGTRAKLLLCLLPFFFRSPCRHRCLSHKTEFGQGNIMFLKVNQNGPRRYSKENGKNFS